MCTLHYSGVIFDLMCLHVHMYYIIVHVWENQKLFACRIYFENLENLVENLEILKIDKPGREFSLRMKACVESGKEAKPPFFGIAPNPHTHSTHPHPSIAHPKTTQDNVKISCFSSKSQARRNWLCNCIRRNCFSHRPHFELFRTSVQTKRSWSKERMEKDDTPGRAARLGGDTIPRTQYH